MNNQSIYVPIYYTANADPLIIKEVCAGLEEEGVPYMCKQLQGNAVLFTSLKVSVLVNENKEIAIFYENLPERPYVAGKNMNGRKAGQNAARMVKGQSLLIEEVGL